MRDLDSAAVNNRITFHPLTPQRWPDLARLFGERGACGGCWCMWWRLTPKEFQSQKGQRNRAAFQHIVMTQPSPGLLAYLDGVPVGWCAVGPRGDYPRLERSRVLAPVDAQAVWSVTCMFVAKPCRHQGLSVHLLRAAAAHAQAQGARILEGYPVDPQGRTVPAAFVWTGLDAAFRQAGFREVARRSPTRPIMRRILVGKD